MRKSNITIYSTLALVALLAACRMGKDYQRSDLSLPTQFASTTAPSDSSVADMEWKKFFSDPTLQSLISHALDNSFDIQLAMKRVDEARAYAKQAKVIHIDIDAAELNKIIKADLAIHADAKEALTALTQLVQPAEHTAWLQGFRDCEKLEYEKVKKKELYPADGQLKMAEVIRLISEKTKGEAVLVTDVGQHQMVASRYYEFKNPNTNITSGGLGTMGFALPASMGAKVAAPGKEVVAIIGDGCFQMTLQELATIHQSEIGVKIVILNNNFLGMVRQWQQLFFDKRYSSTEMTNPDFVAIAKGFFIEAHKVEKREDISAALDEMLQHKGAYLLEVVVEKEDNVFPMVPAGAPIADIRLE